jgi:hypothetical protein
MTAKFNLSATTAQKEASLYGAGGGTEYVLNLQEQLDISSLVEEQIAPSSIRESVWDAGDGPTPGLRQGDLSLVVDLGALSSNAGGIIADDYSGALIAAAIGTSSGGTGTECAAAWDTVTGDVDSAAGLAEAEMVLVETSTGHWAAAIEDITGTTLTLDPPLKTAPAEDAVVYAGVTYTPSETRTSWVVKHHRDANKMGVQCTGVTFVPEFSNLGAQEGKARLTLKGMLGDHAKIASTLGSVGSPDTFTEPGVVQDQGRFVLTDGTDTVECIATTFNFTNPLTQVRRADACQPNTNGEADIMPSMDRMIEVELWQASGADDPLDQLRIWLAAGDMLRCLYQVGNGPAETIAWYFPAVYINADIVPVDKNGLMALKVTLKVSLDGASSVFTVPWYFARF